MRFQREIKGVNISINIPEKKIYDSYSSKDAYGFSASIMTDSSNRAYHLNVNTNTDGTYTCKTSKGTATGKPGQTLIIPDSNSTVWTVALPN